MFFEKNFQLLLMGLGPCADIAIKMEEKFVKSILGGGGYWVYGFERCAGVMQFAKGIGR